MNEQRRKLWLYLYPDEEHQREAIKIIENIPQRQRAIFFRDSLITGIAISKIDKRLPSLLSLILDKKSNINTLINTFRLIIPKFHENIKNNTDIPEIIAWQKRTIDILKEGNPWSTWFAISKEEYEKSINISNNNIQVRALYGSKNGDNNIKNHQNPSTSLENKNSDQNNHSEIINNAKKMFGIKIN